MGLFGFNFGGKESIPEEYKKGTSDNPQSGKSSKLGNDFVGKEELQDSSMNPEEALLAKEQMKQIETEQDTMVDPDKLREMDERGAWDDKAEKMEQGEDELIAASQRGGSEIKRGMKSTMRETPGHDGTSAEWRRTPGNRQAPVKQRDKDRKKDVINKKLSS